VLNVISEDFNMSSLFEKHNSNAVRIYMGPGVGWMLCIQDIDLMDDVSDSSAFPKWPGAMNAYAHDPAQTA
jgi:hypothetical protein